MAKSLICLLFCMIPFQIRFHGYMDKLSRRLTKPNVTLPDFFCNKIYLFPSDIVIFVLLLSLLFYYRISLRKFFWEGPSKYLILLFSVFLLSTYLSSSGSYALQYLRLMGFSFCFLFFQAVSSMENRGRLFLGVAYVLMGCALFESSIGIWQYLSQNSVGLDSFGEKNIHFFPFPYEGPLFTFGPEISPLLYRASGTFSHPNILGGFLFAAIMASYYIYSQITKKRWIIGSCIALQLFVLFLTFSRAAMLALCFATFFWALLKIKNREFKLISSLSCILFLTIIFSFSCLYKPLLARGGFFNYNKVTQHADSERVTYMKAATQMVKKYPLLGVGYNHFQIDAYQLQSQYPAFTLFSKVHNIYLLIAAESGLVGIGVFMLFLFSLFKNVLRDIREKNREKELLLCLFFGLLLIGGCDFYLLENPHGGLLFFGVAGLLARKSPSCYPLSYPNEFESWNLGKEAP